jgi:hypothetical protein
MDNVEANYRTDEQLKAILAETGHCVGIGPQEQALWLSANLQRVIGLVGDPVQSEQLKKIIAGFDLPPIK